MLVTLFMLESYFMNKTNVNLTSPSQEILNNLLEHCQNQRFNEAEKLATSITKKFPKHQFTWKVLGIIFGELNKNSEAVKANQTAISLSPEDHEAHNNLGIAFKNLDRLEEAEKSYEQAIKLKPDLADAYNNLGVALQELGRLEEAMNNFIKD